MSFGSISDLAAVSRRAIPPRAEGGILEKTLPARAKGVRAPSTITMRSEFIIFLGASSYLLFEGLYKGMANLLWRFPGYLVWAAAAYMIMAGSMSVPLTGDQKVYVSTAMEMREHGQWLQPLLFGEPSYYKPPFQ